MIYLNNAATSYPKPESVIAAVSHHLNQIPNEPGRGGFEGQDDILTTCRMNIGMLFRIGDISRIILTSGSTSALNFVIQGLFKLNSGGHCITSSHEHNSVLRPLNHQSRNKNFRITHLPLDTILDLNQFEKSLDKQPTFVVINHVSNVTGTILPIRELAHLCARKHIPICIDASQSAGSFAIDVRDFPGNIILVFTGHKGLMGPMGTGGFYLGSEIELFEPIIQGGTGIRSDLMYQPKDLPLYYESGTMNLPGFAGLAAGVAAVCEIGAPRIGQHKNQLFCRLRESVKKSELLKLFEPYEKNYTGGVFSFAIKGVNPSDIGMILKDSFGIINRSGLHCAPLIHREIGSSPQGTVRLSCSWFTTFEEIDTAADAINKILKKIE
ncbi:aminotransferase class V-fold PLP-dependent enzyme [candidate division KSB1 bacterium]|nr:aminotransferase class V-fold PLP-dependent enzyme [candidate division KSB1 bacterium]